MLSFPLFKAPQLIGCVGSHHVHSACSGGFPKALLLLYNPAIELQCSLFHLHAPSMICAEHTPQAFMLYLGPVGPPNDLLP